MNYKTPRSVTNRLAILKKTHGIAFGGNKSSSAPKTTQTSGASNQQGPRAPVQHRVTKKVSTPRKALPVTKPKVKTYAEDSDDQWTDADIKSDGKSLTLYGGEDVD